MLEIVVVTLKRPKANTESDRDIRLQNSTLRKDLENSHILSIKILSFLSNPTQSEPALHLVSDFNLFLSAHSQYITVAEIKHVMRKTHELVLLTLEEKLFLEYVRIFSDLQVRLVEILFSVVLKSSFGKFE